MADIFLPIEHKRMLSIKINLGWSDIDQPKAFCARLEHQAKSELREARSVVHIGLVNLAKVRIANLDDGEREIGYVHDVVRSVRNWSVYPSCTSKSLKTDVIQMAKMRTSCHIL